MLAGVLVALLVADRLLKRWGDAWMKRLPESEQPMLKTRYRMLRRVIIAVLVFMGSAIVLFNVESTRGFAQTVLASSAVLGLAVGFAARSTLANFVAGVMIAVNQPVRLGDRTQIGESEGVVEDVGLTYTRLRTADNRRVLIPNEELANGRVVNLTLIDPISLAQVRVTVPLESDPARVREVLAELVPLAPGRTGDRPDPGVTVAELTETAAVFQLGVWTGDAGQAGHTANWLREQILARLADEGVFKDVAAEVVK